MKVEISPRGLGANDSAGRTIGLHRLVNIVRSPNVEKLFEVKGIRSSLRMRSNDRAHSTLAVDSFWYVILDHTFGSIRNL